ncbi:TolC family protein [Cohaesibacter celericrescens]|uniref:Transporter n=1 Tax=Cohaesibacter celericrescens TaxID=2067669 RepID=A0A2N5XUH0_9HYPH|nr:TolC family protein [Cohaesibacter celericrescens]PLW78166.1 hypothetical protein C0081_05845 [Cohaesibacter celericrescens]
MVVTGSMNKLHQGAMRVLVQRLLRLSCAVFAAVLGLSVLGAEGVRADNLSQMLYDVYDNNPDIRAEEAGLDVKRASTKKTRSAFMPQIDAFGSHSLTKERLKSGSTTRTRTSQYGVSASQRLFNGFQTRNNLIKSKYEERSSAYQVRNRERQILLEAVKAYMDVYAARRMINLRRQHLSNLEKQRRATLARIRAGELTRTDLSKTEVLLYRAKASLEGALADLGGAAGRYESLVGYKPGELIYPEMPIRYMPKTKEEAANKALRMHPDLRSSRSDIKATEYAVKAAKGAFLPSIDLSGEVSRNFASSQAETTKTERSFSLRLSLPIFDGGARLADVEKAQAEHSQRKYISNALAARIKADAKEQYLRNRAAQATLRQASAEVKAARALLRGIKIEEKAGQRSFLDILDAEVSLLDAQELEIYSKADSVIALYTFLASTGQLTVSGARKAQIQHDPDARAAVAKAEQLARARIQPAKQAGPRKPQDPWSGLR